MLLDVCLGTRTAWKILFVLSESPGKAITRKDIQSLTKLGNKMISKFLLLLERYGVVTIAKQGKRHYYKLNLSSQIVQKVLELIALEKKELNNPDFFALNILREFIYALTNCNLENLRTVILFGSYAKRTFNEGSDIDVAIILKEKSPNEEVLIAEIIDNLNKRFHKEIQPHYYRLQEFENNKKKDKLVQDIVNDGIVLMG